MVEILYLIFGMGVYQLMQFFSDLAILLLSIFSATIVVYIFLKIMSDNY